MNWSAHRASPPAAMSRVGRLSGATRSAAPEKLGYDVLCVRRHHAVSRIAFHAASQRWVQTRADGVVVVAAVDANHGNAAKLLELRFDREIVGSYHAARQVDPVEVKVG